MAKTAAKWRLHRHFFVLKKDVADVNGITNGLGTKRILTPKCDCEQARAHGKSNDFIFARGVDAERYLVMYNSL